MALVERIKEDKVEVVGDYNHIQVRQDKQIIDDSDNSIRAKDNFHRYVLSPGDDVSGESDHIKAIAGAVWTQQIIDDYAAYLESIKS